MCSCLVLMCLKARVAGLLEAVFGARIVIIDDDCPGVVCFEQDVLEVQEQADDQVLKARIDPERGRRRAFSPVFPRFSTFFQGFRLIFRPFLGLKTGAGEAHGRQ